MRLLTPKNRMRLAWILLIASVIAWPVTALTIFREEPQGILGLSYLAIILTCIDVLSTQDVRKEQE